MPVKLVPFSQMSAHYCEYCYLSNLSDPNVLRSTDDITNIDYRDQSNQVSDDELGVGTSTRLFLCGELQDDVEGTAT